MKQQKTVESRVLEILKECPMSRYDDMLLILHYYNRYGYIPAGNLPLEDIVFNYRAYGLPCFETIRRARQRVQSLFPEYSRNPQKEEQQALMRATMEKVLRLRKASVKKIHISRFRGRRWRSVSGNLSEWTDT